MQLKTASYENKYSMNNLDDKTYVIKNQEEVLL